jgi:hypothetical protein
MPSKHKTLNSSPNTTKNITNKIKINKIKDFFESGIVVQVVECLFSKCGALSSTPNAAKK